MILKVSSEQVGMRLDRCLAERAPSRAYIQKQIEAGAVLVDGELARAAQSLKQGQIIEWTPIEEPPIDLQPEDIPLDVVYEDEAIIVVNKQAGLVVHPAAGHRTGTLVHALLGRSGGGNPQRPGIVHRLDKGTTGLIVVARGPQAYASLGKQFREHSAGRTYSAIVVGSPEASGTVRTLYGRHPRSRKKFSSKVRGGKEAVTHWKVSEKLCGATLVEARLETGRTHQVRVHLADMGHPLVGDDTYGRSPKDERLREVASRLGRPALHAATLTLEHPTRGGRLTFDAPLPADFARALERLRC